MIRKSNSKNTSFVTNIDISLVEKMTQDLRGQGFSLSRPEYTLFSAKKPGVICTLYESGKLVVQGKQKDAFIEYYLEPEILGTFEYSHREAYLDKTDRMGSDEAGKGDFFGPLCICTAFADEGKVMALSKLGVRDSKSFNDKIISELARDIEKMLPHQVIRLMPAKYNELYAKFNNLNRLLAWAHAAAINGVFEKTGCKKVIVDQFASNSVMKDALDRKNIPVDLIERVRGEEDIVVAAASIMARNAFVKAIDELEEQYGLPFPKGATKPVIQAGSNFIKKYGRDELSNVGKLHFKTADELG